MLRPLWIAVDIFLTIGAAVVIAYGVGELFIWLWAPTPTPDNASLPPEAFLFVAGALVGFVAACFARIAFGIWRGRRATSCA